MGGNTKIIYCQIFLCLNGDCDRGIVKGLEVLRSSYREMFAKDRSRETLETLVDYLIGSPITSITQVQESLKISSFNMNQRKIEKLETLEIVREVTGNKRDRIYHAGEILKVLEERL